MKVALAGEGAIARQHASALARIGEAELAFLVGGDPQDTSDFARAHGIPRWSLDLEDCLTREEIEAVILATPTPLHARQARQVLEAGKHVLVEIPMADNLADARQLAEAHKDSGRTAMVCHTRRFNPSHQWVHTRLRSGELQLKHLVVETFFLRRENRNALGKPRTWTDSLLWHHACHTVDLFQYQTGVTDPDAWAQEGPSHRELGIAMDMTVALKTPSGILCSLALSFNNDGPFGTTFRYICDNGTFIARYDELVDGYGQPIDVTGVAHDGDGIELQDREFFTAIAEGREPNASFRQCLPAMETLQRIQEALSP